MSTWSSPGSRLTRQPSRRRTSAPASPGSARQPSGTQIVQSGSASTVGTRTDRTGDRASGRSVTARGAGRRAVARRRDHLDRRVGPVVAVAPPVLVAERVDARHGDLVALPGVAAVHAVSTTTSAPPPTACLASSPSDARADSSPSTDAGVGDDRTTSWRRGLDNNPTARGRPGAGCTGRSTCRRVVVQPSPPRRGAVVADPGVGGGARVGSGVARRGGQAGGGGWSRRRRRDRRRLPLRGAGPRAHRSPSVDAFDAEHERRNGHGVAGVPIEVVALRARARRWRRRCRWSRSCPGRSRPGSGGVGPVGAGGG